MTNLAVTVVSEDEIYLNKEIYSLESLGEALADVTDEEREAISAVVIEGGSDCLLRTSCAGPRSAPDKPFRRRKFEDERA